MSLSAMKRGRILFPTQIQRLVGIGWSDWIIIGLPVLEFCDLNPGTVTTNTGSA